MQRASLDPTVVDVPRPTGRAVTAAVGWIPSGRPRPQGRPRPDAPAWWVRGAAVDERARPVAGSAPTGRADPRPRPGPRASAEVVALAAPAAVADDLPVAGGSATGSAAPEPPASTATGQPPVPRSVVGLLAVAMLVALVVGIASVVAPGGADRGGQGDGAPEVAVVQPGQTLWDVAVATAPAGTDPVVQLTLLQQANDVPPGTLRAWTTLRLP